MVYQHSSKWTPSHGERIIRRLEKDIFPWLGRRPIIEITAVELLNTLRRIESRGVIETAHRSHQNCGQVFRYAIATGRVKRDVSLGLRGAKTQGVSLNQYLLYLLTERHSGMYQH